MATINITKEIHLSGNVTVTIQQDGKVVLSVPVLGEPYDGRAEFAPSDFIEEFKEAAQFVDEQTREQRRDDSWLPETRSRSVRAGTGRNHGSV